MQTEKMTDRSILKALEAIRHFIAETTGLAPTDAELADALERYFVLNEIKAHILMDREQKSKA